MSDQTTGIDDQSLTTRTTNGAGKMMLGKYKVTGVLASSRISTVLKAIDTSDQSIVAVKILSSSDPSLTAAYTNEMDLVSRVSHPNIPEFITYEENCYVMQFVNGLSLQQLLAKLNHVRKFTDLYRLLKQLASPLIAIHEHGFVHGNVNPKNILFEKRNGQVGIKLVGFGESAVRGILASSNDFVSESPYLSNEDRDEFLATVQSDIYSVGAIAFAALTGRPPALEQSGDANDIAETICSCVPDSVEHIEELAFVIGKSLAARDQRYDEMAKLGQGLEAWKASVQQTRAPDKKLDAEVSQVLRAEGISSAPVPVSPAGQEEGIEFGAVEAPLAVSIDEGEVVPASGAEQETAEIPAHEDMKPAAASVEETAVVTPEEREAEKAPVVVLPEVQSQTVLNAPNAVAPAVPAGESEALPEVPPRKPRQTLDHEAALLVGKIVFEKYVVLELVSRSELATVYLGSELTTDRPVAMKTLMHPELETVLAFAREVQEVSLLDHPNIVEFLDYKEYEDYPFYIMEFVEGPTLTELLESIKRMETEEQIAGTIVQICDAVEFLHENGLYHNNLRPESIMLQESEGRMVVKVGGFGTAPVRSMLEGRGELDLGNLPKVDKETHDFSDQHIAIYQIAAVGYELITGLKPFGTFHQDLLNEGKTRLQKITLLRPELFRADILDSIFEKALTTGQFKTIADFRQAVSSWNKAIADDLSDSLAENADILSSGSRARAWHSIKALKDSLEEDEEQKIGELKSTQIKGEKTLGMLFTRIVSVKGRRESPLFTILQLSCLLAAGVLTVYSVFTYVQANYNELKEGYLGISQQVSSRVWHGRKSGDTGGQSAWADRFSYSEDPAYKRWARGKVVGAARRIEGSGKLVEK